MTHDIFIRTYRGDLEWLKYALRSIAKHVRGYRDIIIVIPENHYHLLTPFNLTKEKIFKCPIYKDDYMGQQVSKLEAFRYTGADYITFWDSDVIATKPIDLGDYILHGNPILYKTDYNKIPSARHWQRITAKAIGFIPAYEYMRRMPLTYRISSLQKLQEKFHTLNNVGISHYVGKQPNREFSEFNVLGYYIDLYEQDKYCIIDTEKTEMPENKVKQYRSWDGLNSTTINEIENYLK